MRLAVSGNVYRVDTGVALYSGLCAGGEFVCLNAYWKSACVKGYSQRGKNE